MTYRVLLLVPEGLTFGSLPHEAQAAINTVLGQFVNPMPNTQAAGGYQVVDAVTADNFDPNTMGDYGINWPILGMWDEEGKDLIPLNKDQFMKHLPDGAELHEPHRWLGWPKLFGE